MKEITLNASGLKIGIVTGRFNELIGERLERGAQEMLLRCGAKQSDITRVTVPGAFEIPLMLQALAETKAFDALIALGAVIRGSTPHFDYVAGEAAKGIAALRLPTIFPSDSAF